MKHVVPVDAVAGGSVLHHPGQKRERGIAPELPIHAHACTTGEATGKQVYRQLFDYFYDDPMRVAVSLGRLSPGVYDLDATLAGKDASRPVDLDLTGVRRLTIVVDFGESLGMGDYLLLCNARLSK